MSLDSGFLYRTAALMHCKDIVGTTVSPRGLTYMCSELKNLLLLDLSFVRRRPVGIYCAFTSCGWVESMQIRITQTDVGYLRIQFPQIAIKFSVTTWTEFSTNWDV